MITPTDLFRAGADQARSILQSRRASEILDAWDDKQIALGQPTTQQTEFDLALRASTQED